MTRTLAISDTGLRLIKAFEGFRPDDRTLVTGIRVVGYGHRLETDADPVHMSRADAEEQLLDDLEPIEEIVNDEVHAPLSQGQFDALCSLALNIGVDAFRSSDIVRAMNNGRVLDAANGFDVWRKATVNGKTYVVDALMRRRTAEKSLFLRNEPAVPAPSAMLRPEADGVAPLGSTDDGLPKVTVAEATGVIAAANIINADRVDLADAPVGVLTVSDLVNGDDVIAADDSLLDVDLVDEDAFDDAEDLGGVSEDIVEDILDDDGDVLDDESDLDDADDLIEGDLDDADLDDDYLDDDSEDDFDADSDDDFEDDEDDIAGYDDDLTDIDDDDLLDDDADDDQETDHIETMSLTTASDMDNAEQSDLEESSVISSAATSLGDRLSALLDTDDSEPKVDSIDKLPASFLQATDTADVIDAAPTLVAAENEDTARSNLVSFPKRELVLDESIDMGVESSNDVDTETGLKVIDDLEADDVIRASRDPENPIFDPEGDPVENAMRYLERQASENQAKKSNAGMWIPIALGALLVGASAVLIGRGATQMLSTWGPTAVTAAAITGGLTVIFAIYAAARGRLA
jgi:GH24 family phage-related lysozyme (muramidase)